MSQLKKDNLAKVPTNRICNKSRRVFKLAYWSLPLITAILFAGCLAARVRGSKLPFKTEEIEFYNGKLKLSATLFVPDHPGKYPAVAITHGSSKDSKAHAGFISLATILVQEGLVVLIYDKRGVGGSAGVYVETPDMAAPAGDLIAAISYLRERKEVDKNKMGVYGHSQGGWVAPLAAVGCRDISFVVVACGGGVSVRETVLYSMRTELKLKGFTTPVIDSMIIFSRQFYTYLGTGIGYAAANAAYIEAVKQPWFSFFKAMRFTEQLPPPSMLKEAPFNFFKAINYDPQSTLRELDIPALLILGGKDESVPSAISKQLWEDAFYAAGHQADLSVDLLPAEDHYDFERANGVVVYKRSFADVLVKWLKDKIIK